MKALIGAVIVVLMIGAQSAYAETAFQSGFKHGVADGRQSDTTQWYILQPNNGFAIIQNNSTEDMLQVGVRSTQSFQGVTRIRQVSIAGWVQIQLHG